MRDDQPDHFHFSGGTNLFSAARNSANARHGFSALSSCAISMNFPLRSAALIVPAFSLFLTLHAGRVMAQQSVALPTGVEKVTSVEGITEYRLTNGLQVLLFPD